MKWCNALNTFLLNCITYHKKYIHNSGQLSVFVLETGLGLGDHGGWIISQFSGWPSQHISLKVSGWADGEAWSDKCAEKGGIPSDSLLFPLWLQICVACKKDQQCHFGSLWLWLLLFTDSNIKKKKKIRIVCKATIRKFCMMCSINCYMISSEWSFSGVGLSFCKWPLVLHSGFI